MKKALEVYKNNIGNYREVFCAENPGMYLGNQEGNVDSNKFNYLKNISNLDSVDNSINRDKLNKSKNSNIQISNDEEFKLPKAEPRSGDKNNIGRNKSKESLNNSNEDNSASNLKAEQSAGNLNNNNFNSNSGSNLNNNNNNNTGDINTNAKK